MPGVPAAWLLSRSGDQRGHARGTPQLGAVLVRPPRGRRPGVWNGTVRDGPGQEPRPDAGAAEEAPPPGAARSVRLPRRVCRNDGVWWGVSGVWSKQACVSFHMVVIVQWQQCGASRRARATSRPDRRTRTGTGHLVCEIRGLSTFGV